MQSRWEETSHGALSSSNKFIKEKVKSEECMDLEESESDLCEMDDESESESSSIDENLDPSEVLKITWKTLSPPVTDECVIGNRPYFRKKRQHLLREKRAHIFIFTEKMVHFFHFQEGHFYHATLMLMHEMPKIGPEKVVCCGL